MKITPLEIEGLLLIEPRVFTDERGSFFESFNTQRYREVLGEQVQFVQDNLSVSHKNVIRGLHFQHPPFEQGKLVSVAKGRVLDVAVDIRRASPTYGKHVKVELSSENRLQLWIPPGFAHGFAALEDDTVFSYKCSAYYSPQSEDTIQWDSPELAIDWGISDPIVSSKDRSGKDFVIFASPF